MRQIAPALPLDEILEKDLQRQVFDLAAATGWRRSYHVFDSRRSASGFPDLVLVRDRVVFAELKRERGKLTPAQVDWLQALQNADAEVYVVRPRNLDAIAHVLAARRMPTSPYFTSHAASIARGELLEQLRKELLA